MKKQLLSTSAIALGVAMAAPASAQQWDLDWGGFANTHIGASDIDLPAGDTRDFDGVNVYTNSEIIFSPSVTLDNGLTFGFSVQMEALNSGGGADGIDESYVTIEGDMLGKIVLGSENSAGYALMGSVYTPGVDTMAVNSRSTSAFVPVTGSTGFRQAGLSSLTEVAGNNDVQRISYFTPSFNGLTVGVSYAPSNAGNASNNSPVDFDSTTNVTDIFDIGVGYQQSFQGVDLGLAARWGTGNVNVAGIDDPTTWAIGGTMGVNAFTFGATYSENDNGLPNGEAAALDSNGNLVAISGNPAVASVAGTGNQEGYSFGATYDIVGPWSIGGEMYFGEEKTVNADNEYEAYKIAAARDLGAGVSWNVYYYYMETKNGVSGDKIEGNVIATAINLSF